MKITTICPISRISYLDRVIESLLNQTYRPNNLIVIFDGSENEFLHVRNKIIGLDFDNILCVPSRNVRPAFTIHERRWHIVNIHNQIRELLGDCDWVFSIEDDGILPRDALERLVKVVTNTNNVGIATGVELGRWGIKYVGAWVADDVSNAQSLTSLENKSASNMLQEIDGCGLYCALIRADIYKSHEFDTRNGIGPDVNLGLYARQNGYQNYIDWGIHVTHLTNHLGEEKEIKATDECRTVKLSLSYGSIWTVNLLDNL
jgi:glycosyltransferase involved in cell wall biosynthesis